MLWTLNQARRLGSDDHWLNHCLGKAILFLALLLSSPALATDDWAYSDYWGLNGWKQLPDLATVPLNIAKSSGNGITLSWVIDAPPNTNDAGVFLQTTTNLSSEGEWTVVTNSPQIFPDTGHRSALLPMTDPQRFFRLIAVETNGFPVFSFAIFHAGQLEFTWTPSLRIRGRTHANGPICMGAASGQTLQFDQTVTTASSIVVSNLGGYSGFSAPVYAGTPTNRINTPQLTLSGVTNNHTIVELPPADESPSSSQWQQRYYNKAAVVLLISNSTVTVNVKDLGAAASTGIVSNYNYSSYSNIYYPLVASIITERTNMARGLPFLNLTNRFYDYREGKWVMPSQIDISLLKAWLLTNSAVNAKFPAGSGNYPTIMYVGDFRTVTNLHAVRVMNGSIIPTNGPSHSQAQGFTLATINPLYVWGHYNCPNASHLGTTNTTAVFPASLVSDAIVVLSSNWQDATYGNAGSGGYGVSGLSNRDAANTTVNAAIIAGAVYTTGTGAGNWSGGIQNLPRLLEDWYGRTFTLNTALVNLYPSVKATAQHQNPGYYYYAPIRNFNLDQNFANPAKLPPGTPTVYTFTPIQ